MPTTALALLMAIVLVAVPASAGPLDTVLLSEERSTDQGYQAVCCGGEPANLYDLEEVYGDTLSLTTSLTVGQDVLFDIHTPHALEGDRFRDSVAIAFDTDVDGVADFQVIVDAQEEVRYQAVEDGAWTDQPLPDGFEVTIESAQDRTVRVPALELGGITSEYLFVVFATDITDTPVPDPQVYMNIPDDTFDPFDSVDPDHPFTSSDNYASACVGICLPV